MRLTFTKKNAIMVLFVRTIPKTVILTADRKDPKMNFSKLEEYLNLLPRYGLPACDFAVSHRGKTVYRHASGFSDVEKTKPVSENDLYYVFSISKITTCVAAMRLVEEGKLALSDPVSKYLPAFAHLTVKNSSGKPTPAKTPMTILHLFTMTGGLNYDLSTPAVLRRCQDPSAGTLEIVSAFAESALEFEPGTKYLYSLCHDVLGAVVEVVSGMLLCDYVKTYIFDPLGMKDTGFHLPPALLPRVSAQYQFVPRVMRATPVETGNNYILSDNYDSGGAGLYSSVSDQSRLMAVLASGGKTENGYSLLRPETIAMMGKNYLPESAMPQFLPTRLYGYGWGLCGRCHLDPALSQSRSAVGEFGWDGAAGSFGLVDPEKQVGMFFATHVRGCAFVYHMVHPTLRDLAYEAIEG